MSTHAVQVRGLTKVFPGRDGPVNAVNGIDIDIEVGECFGLLGPNGAGKTTTVEILEGLTEPTGGDVEIFGLRWKSHAEEIRQRTGVTLQETRFPEKETTLELARLFRSFYKTGSEPEEVLKRVALDGKANAYVETLSGGQQQRLAVALALVGDPELLFLDEPTTGLDPQARHQLWSVIRDLQDKGRTTVLTTHYMDEAEKLCDRIAIIDGGKIIALGSPRELISRLGGEHVIEIGLEPRDDLPAADRFLGVAGVLTARREDQGYLLTVSEPHRAIPALIETLEADGCPLARLTTRHASLEDVFVSLTGRHLRDNEEAVQEREPRGRGRRRKRPPRGD